MPTSGALSGLLRAVLPDAGLRSVVEHAGTGLLELEGPPAARPLVTAALAAPEEIGGAGQTVLMVTATGHDTDGFARINDRFHILHVHKSLE